MPVEQTLVYTILLYMPVYFFAAPCLYTRKTSTTIAWRFPAFAEE